MAKYTLEVLSLRDLWPRVWYLTLGSAELEEIKSLRILGVTFDTKLKFDTHLREVVSKAARSLAVVRGAGNVFDCPRVLKSCFNAHVLSSLEYCALVWMSSAESHLGLLEIMRGGISTRQNSALRNFHKTKIVSIK